MSDQLRHHRDDAPRGGAPVDRWTALIDCCRPGSNDAFEPEFAELAPLAEAIVADPAVQERYERSQQFDGAFRQAVLDVPVPGDLAARLLASLTADWDREPERDGERMDAETIDENRKVSPALRSDADAARFSAKHSAAGADLKRTIRWRSWFIAAGVLGLLCSLVYGIVASREHPIPVAEVIEQSRLWRQTVQAERNAWKDNARESSQTSPSKASLSSHPIDRRIVASPRRSRSLKTAYGQAIVYDLRDRSVDPADADRLALLFVVKSNATFALPSSPPFAEPQSHTQGVVTGAWARPNEKLLYVLVIEGNPSRYRKFVHEDRLAQVAPRIGRPKANIRRPA